MLIAPMQTEFGAKVAVLGSLAIACAARPLLEQARALRGRFGWVRFDLALAGALGFVGVVLVAGVPARTSAGAAYRSSPPSLLRRGAPGPFARSFEVLLVRGRYVIVGVRDPSWDPS